MFTSPNIAMHFKSAALRLDGKVPDQRRVADAQYVLSPLMEVRAQELGELIRDHLFIAGGDQPRVELTKSQFRHDGGLYRLTARLDPAIDPELVVDEVSVVKMTAQLEEQEDRAWITFTATVRLPLDTKAAREFVINHFDHPVYLTFEPMQDTLLNNAAVLDAAARIGEHGDVTLSVPGEEPVHLNPKTSRRLRVTADQMRTRTTPSGAL